jgi:tetratricopeptide (TPR) repeat protein
MLKSVRELLGKLADKALLTIERDVKDSRKIIGYDLHPLFRRFVKVEILNDEMATELHYAAVNYFKSIIHTLPSYYNYERKSVIDVWPILEAVYHLNELKNFKEAYDLFFDERLPEALLLWGEAVLASEIYNSWIKPEALAALGSFEAQGAVFGNLANAYLDLGQVDDAINFYIKALSISRSSKNKINESSNLGNLGVAYYSLEKFDEAISYYKQALLISQEIGDRQEESNQLSNLGLVSCELGHLEEAVTYYQKAITISHETDDKAGKARHLGNLGVVYLDQEQTEVAKEYFNKALSLAQEVGDKVNIGYQFYNIGQAYQQLGNFLLAFANWRRASDIFTQLQSPYTMEVQKAINFLKEQLDESSFAQLWIESEKEYENPQNKE